MNPQNHTYLENMMTKYIIFASRTRIITLLKTHSQLFIFFCSKYLNHSYDFSLNLVEFSLKNRITLFV